EPSLHLPVPKDVEIYSYNFHSLLRWSPVPVERGLVLYTVHYKTGAFPEWHEMNCTRIPQPRCPFPAAIQGRRRWTMFLRVRAELARGTSAWAHVGPFVAERNTILGPPKVNSVSSSSDSLLISVSPPVPPEPGETLRYRVFYWQNTTSTTAKELRESQTLLQVGNLKESTLYCFNVRVELERDFDEQLLGQLSAPECHRTAIS
ncbi:INGR2 protein, partial [Formicarius rufipectus]|nr:INGR2 protein [Formicarius rufipectus]